ncbi:MAG TPA: AMP-binding protein [Myxococcota bacterium]|nr:AMP-binding protein [Myxococcota bacterium]
MITLDQIRADRAALQRRWYRERMYTPRTFADEMREGAARFPNARMIFHSGEHPAEATLAQMHADSLRLASALRAIGLGPGDVVAIQVPNWLEGALVFQAAMLLGVVTLPIIHIYGPAEVSFILRQSGARAFICPARWRHIDYLARIAQLDRGALPRLEHVVVIGDAAPSGGLTWDALLARATQRFEPPRVSPDDVCMLVYTSGTTADPKGVQHTHNSLLAEVRAMRRTLDAGASQPGTGLAAFPAGHIAGVLGLARLYVHGSSTVLMDAWNADDAAALIERHRIASSSGTPFFLIGLLDAAAKAARDLRCLDGYMVGAASVPPALVERAERAGVRTYRSYGSSEHPTITSGAPDEPLAKRATTDGRVTPNNEIRIVDDEGDDLPRGVAGEIVSRGPELFVGYRDETLDLESFLPGGWFRTGDVGALDAEGYLAVTDRKKDIIIRGGENISSKEVEDVLARHPAVGEVAVVAAPDSRYGERVCAFVILRAGVSLDLADVQKHFAAAGVARQKTPERLELVRELPRTASGKVKKFELRKGLK